jgi:uncharacterized protein
MQREGDSSVEEILESIKKVIARDNRESALIQRQRRATHGIPTETTAPAEGQVSQPDDVLDLAEEEEMAGPDGPAVCNLPGDPDQSEPLVTSGSCDAMRESLATLAMFAEPPARPQIVRSGETSLEGLAREMLRPMLAEWLEANLPGMVERMVSEEIARIAGKKR